MSLLDLFTRPTKTQETPMPDTATDPAPQTTWPEGVIARYLTIAGATVDLTGGGDYTYARCTGCPYGHGGGLWWTESQAHGYAQGHAEKCRALPRPTA